MKGALYGTTGGYPNGDGTIFSISTTGMEQVLHNFSGYPDGAHPFGGLINENGTLYGTALAGGCCLSGAVFALTL